MKFSKRLASMLFEIYPEARSMRYYEYGYDKYNCVLNGKVGFHFKLTCEPHRIDTLEARDVTDVFEEVITQPADEGEPTEYKREDVFVYGDIVEVKESSSLKDVWVLGKFISYWDNRIITNFWSIDEEDVRKPQPKEEMVKIKYKKQGELYANGDDIWINKQIPKSKAIELGLLEE